MQIRGKSASFVLPVPCQPYRESSNGILEFVLAILLNAAAREMSFSQTTSDLWGVENDGVSDSWNDADDQERKS